MRSLALLCGRVHRLPSLCSTPELWSESPPRCRHRTFRGGTWSPTLTRASRWVKSVLGFLVIAQLCRQIRGRRLTTPTGGVLAAVLSSAFCAPRGLPSAHGLLPSL
ncbi:hypothetical protein MRX96_032244 [Rhipicephalus microplus]